MSTIADSSASDQVVSGLRETGWAVVDAFVERPAALALARECHEARQAGDFRRAGVGRAEHRVIREDIRRDEVSWLDPATAGPAAQAYLGRLETLRQAINQRLFLGLFDFEGHFAVYPLGAFYKAHLDRHRGTQDRVVTAILYLNEDWHPGHAGRLKLWTEPGATDGPIEWIEPRLGTLVCFLAGAHWHEVEPARHTRASITGWFRIRA